MTYSSTAISALTRESLRSQMVTSMLGRRSGMDIQGYEVGEQDTRLPVDNNTSTIGTSFSPNGVSILGTGAATTGSLTNTLLTAVSGVYKQLSQLTSSTYGQVVQFGANANIVTSAGSSFNQITFAGVGHTVSLFCVSSSTATGPIWLCSSPPSPGLTFSTY